MKYDWENNAESWHKGLHAWRRFLRLDAGGTFLSAFILASLAVVTSYSELRFLRGTSLNFLLISAGICLLSALLGAYRLHRGRIIAERVPLHNARVCPKCLAVLEPESAGESVDDTPLTLHCPSCSTSLVLSEIEDYWATFPGQKVALPSWRRNLNWYSYRGDYDPNQPLALAFYLKPRTLGIITILALAAYPLLVSILGSGSVLVGLVEHSYLLLLLPFSLFVYASYRRKGRSVHCHKCHYEKAPDMGHRCSECGEEWCWPFQCLRGQKKTSLLRHCIAATLLIALVLGPLFLSWMGAGMMIMRIIPTSSLITQIAEGRHAFLMDDEWTALNKRTLSPDETNALFLGLLDRYHNQPMYGEARDWFIAQLKHGMIFRNLLKQYYQNSIGIYSITPTAATPGKTLFLSFSPQNNTIRDPNVYARLLIEGIEINGQPDPHDRPDKALIPYHFFRKPAPEEFYTWPNPLVMPDHSGPLNIRIIYWQVLVPKNSRFYLAKWNDDDTPILPPDTLWANRIEQDFTITVK